MRRGRLGGTCHDCGKQAKEGLFWEPAPVDLGKDKTDFIEPDMSGPVRCDACEQKHQERSSECR